jgi:hypothetical protein
MQWSTTSQSSDSQGVAVLVYGGAGEGKTLLCATAPKPVILSAESGLLSLRRKNIERVYGVNTPGVTYDIPTMQISNVDDLAAAYAWFASPASRAREYFNTICLDSLSEIAEVVLSNAKKLVKDPRQAYGEVIEKTVMLVRSFRDLPGFHKYMAAKMEFSKDEVSGANKYQPAMPGSKLGQQLPYFFDEVFCLRTSQPQGNVKGYRYLQTQPDFQYVAKDRSGVLDEIEKPDLSHVFHKILQG